MEGAYVILSEPETLELCNFRQSLAPTTTTTRQHTIDTDVAFCRSILDAFRWGQVSLHVFLVPAPP